jgi:pimeloyl-ACP methyl ester carboxylesterase
MRRSISLVALALAVVACAGPRHDVRSDGTSVAGGGAPPAPAADGSVALDPEVAALPGARAVWLGDPEFGPIYVVTAGVARDPGEPPVLFVHGLGTNGMRDFYPVLPPIAAHRRVVLLDLPGFGRSPHANVKYAPDRYAAVLSRVIATVGGGPVDVVGHSMGGAITLFHAANYPEQVRRLIVVDAAGVLHRDAWFAHHLRRVTDPARIVLPRVADILGEAADLFSDTTRLLEPAPELILEVAALRNKLLGGRPERIAALGLILQDFGPVIARIRAPTLVVWGADDVIAPLRTGLMLADRLPDARLVVLPGVGHQVMAQAPSLLVPEIERHIGASGPAPRAPAAAPGPSQGQAVCKGQPEMQLTGVYDSVVIEDCGHVTLDQVRTRSLVIRRSAASIVRSSFSAGIVADSATLIITGGDIGGEVAIDARDSKLDLAGVAIGAGREPFRTSGQCRLLLSVCPVRTPEGVAYRHGFVDVPAPAASR